MGIYHLPEGKGVKARPGFSEILRLPLTEKGKNDTIVNNYGRGREAGAGLLSFGAMILNAY